MWQLIKFELMKIFQKKIVWACCGSMAFMTVMMVLNWIYPASDAVQYMADGQLVQVENKDAVKVNQEIAQQWAGPLTDEKVREILQTYHWTDADMEANGLDPRQQGKYTHNFLTSVLHSEFKALDGSWNGSSVSDVYPAGEENLNVGYTSGWVNSIYAVIYTILSLGCIIIIMVSPVFAEEYSRGTDALILTSRYGRTKCSTAKIIASFIASMSLTAAVIAIMFGICVLTYGPAGWEASLQFNNLRIFEEIPYGMTCGEGVLFGCLMWFAAMAVLTAFTILFSAVCRNAFTSLILSFAVYVIPMFIAWGKQPLLQAIGNLFPINQMQLLKLFEFEKINMGGMQIHFMWITVPIGIVAVGLFTAGAKRGFSRHQVMG